MGSRAPTSNRYAFLVRDQELDQWQATFNFFDQDGEGDIDLKELGVVFRQLGMTPNHAQLAQMMSEIDADRSKKIDFEEFCLLMLRLKRSAATPNWLRRLFAGGQRSTAADWLDGLQDGDESGGDSGRDEGAERGAEMGRDDEGGGVGAEPGGKGCDVARA